MLRPDAALLTDRVVVVTGAATGIGKATALACAAFGADVAVCDRNEHGLRNVAKQVESEGRRALTAVLDVRDAAAVHLHLAEVGQTFGRVDVLVNNAGGGFVSPFVDVTPKGQQVLIDENFTSVTTFVRGCVPLMPSDGGAIVNISSVEAHRGAPNFAIYAAMKAAVESLTRTLALELADRCIRVNCVAPDAIPTAGDAALVEVVQGQTSAPYATPLPYAGSPDDCAAAVVFLASPMARFITGTTLHVGGGTDAARGWRRDADGNWVP